MPRARVPLPGSPIRRKRTETLSARDVIFNEVALTADVVPPGLDFWGRRLF